MKKEKRKHKKIKPRLPVSVLFRLGSHATTTKKGAKGYDRKKVKDEEGIFDDFVDMRPSL